MKSVVGGETTYSFYSRLTGGLLYTKNPADAAKNMDYIHAGKAPIVRLKGSGASYSETFLHADHLGSPAAATDHAGAILWRESYAPFGEKRLDPAANKDATGFTGHVQDDAN